MDLVSESERHTGDRMCETVADAAYGDGETRWQFVEAERTLVAKVPKPPRSPYFTKQDFPIDLEADHCTCPAGEVTNLLYRQERDRDGYGKRMPLRAFVFVGAACDGCRLRLQCVKAALGRGHSVSLHPQEGLLQAARVFQASAASAPIGLGARTEAQLLLTATVVNLTCIWAQAPA